MEVFWALGGLALVILAMGFLFNGFPDINIHRHYGGEKSKKSKEGREGKQSSLVGLPTRQRCLPCEAILR